eukprot:TRINITY_DN2693_c0_g1_i6.p1 TRINITY_DN2693_c0_g1~~TRINITY_DN2693_c0_g1_i6.p1  ORF type:complete len:194 (-),score=18.99 TRINITY_DN2693_c0_g1_i6:60-593(-)
MVPILCFLGAFPFGVWCFALPAVLALFMVEVNLSIIMYLRLARLLEIITVCTSPIGIVLLRQRIASRTVPRGCDCCCTCPFPAWSLLFQVLDLVACIVNFLEGDIGTVIVSLVWLVAIALDVAFGVMWIRGLSRQDGNICCHTSVLTKAEQVVVVGQPVTGEFPEAVDGEAQDTAKS